jgi:signal transduction histidine kinase
MHLGLKGPIDIELPHLLLETVQTRFFLFGSLFYLVALLSSMLSRKLVAARRELEGSHRALDRYQFSAESMMEDLPVGLVFFDAGGRLEYRNKLGEEWLERPLEPGMEREAVLMGLVGGDLLAAMRRMGEAFPVREMEIESPSGRPLHVRIKPLSKEGEFLGMVLTFLDFTQERKVARELLRTERMAALGAMSARIAHEIRNPLASISGSAQMLQESLAPGETDRRLLSLIVTESGRLDRTLSSLLQYARDRTPSYRDVSIASIFRKIRLVLEKNPNFNPDLVIVDELIENGDVRFSSDQDILEQVLLNIALNALQALPEGKGILVFRARSEDRDVVIEVRDNGCGMTRQEAARAFEPFFTTKAHGTGLGLATCLHDVHALQGSIQLTSEKSEASASRGTTVRITLPRRQA